MERTGGESATRGAAFVREARLRDEDRIRVLAEQLGYPSDAGEFSRRYQRALEDAETAIFIAERDGRADGWIGVRSADSFYSRDCAEITGLVVDESARGLGLGTALLEKAAAWAGSHGFDTLRLRANAVRTEAHGFYRARGFTEKKRQVVFERRCDASPLPSRSADPPWAERSLGDGIAVRPLAPGDGPALFDLLERERPRLSLRLAFIARIMTPSDAERLVLECRRKARRGEACFWGMFERGLMIGMISISAIDRAIDCGELAYCIDEAHEGLGIVARAMDLMLDHLFVDLGLQKALICCQPDNLRSSSVALRFGFRREGVIRNGFRLKGTLVDIDIYGLLRSEYYALQCGRKT